MKCFISDDHWDILGYRENKKNLKGKLSEETFQFFLNDSFHDAHIYSINLINHFDPDKEEQGEMHPTTLKAHLKHWDGHEYKLT
ncbi:hypothetical protein [Niallia sp. 03133]|uniref:hypothetical protein n=1 Tax=Niallia sp. 03133 TaxID=3458060 RepID=UPI004044061F